MDEVIEGYECKMIDYDDTNDRTEIIRLFISYRCMVHFLSYSKNQDTKASGQNTFRKRKKRNKKNQESMKKNDVIAMLERLKTEEVFSGFEIKASENSLVRRFDW